MVHDNGFTAVYVSIQKDQFGVLSADLDDRPGSRAKITGGPGLSYDLIDIRYPKDIAHKLATAPRSNYPMKGLKVFAQFLKAVTENNQWQAFSTSVHGSLRVCGLINNDYIQTDGTEINSSI